MHQYNQIAYIAATGLPRETTTKCHLNMNACISFGDKKICHFTIYLISSCSIAQDRYKKKRSLLIFESTSYNFTRIISYMTNNTSSYLWWLARCIWYSLRIPLNVLDSRFIYYTSECLVAVLCILGRLAHALAHLHTLPVPIQSEYWHDLNFIAAFQTFTRDMPNTVTMILKDVPEAVVMLAKCVLFAHGSIILHLLIQST